MKEYVANVITSVFPFGVITKGEFLTKQQIDKLGEATIADMVKRGTISVVGDDSAAANTLDLSRKPEDAPPDDGQKPEIAPPDDDQKPEDAPPADEGTDGHEGGDEGDEEEEAEELEPDTMDDVVDEAEEAVPDVKPKKSSGGRKAK